VILLLGAAGGILWYVRRGNETPPPTPAPSVSVPASTAEPATTLDLPPIPIEIDAGPDTGGEKPKPATTGTGGGGGGCACTTSGSISDDIAKAAAARGGTAKQCYKTALEGNEGLAGTVTAQVRIGANGEACSVTIASDTTGSSKLQNCVRQKMAAGGYPKPKGGCVDVKVPVVFSTQH
jgi:hypothetical protein